MCSFRIHESTRFLKCFSDKFKYEGFDYNNLPMFYEVLQSKHDQNGALRATHDIHIYGYYIDSPKTISLKTRVIEYCQNYINRLNNGANNLYNVNVLPTSLLRRVIKLAKCKIRDIDNIKLYCVRAAEFGKVMRVYRGTESEDDCSNTLDKIDRLIKNYKLVKIPILYCANINEKHLNKLPHMLNIFNIGFVRKMLCELVIRSNIGFKLFSYFENSSLFYNVYTEQPYAYFKHNLAEIE